MRPWFAARALDEVREVFAGNGVSWGPLPDPQLVEEASRCSIANPMFDELEHPGVGSYLLPRSPLDFSASGRLPVTRAPILGEHSRGDPRRRAGLDAPAIAAQFDRRVVAGPVEALAA
jgi:2-methylfumaryl-CoA isomerase